MSEEQKIESKESVSEETTSQPTEVGTEEIEQFMAELEKANVKTPGQLQGHLTNAKDYHKIQGEKDLLANKVADMEKKLDNLDKPPKKNEWEEETNQYSSPLNLKEEFIGALREYESIKQQENMRVQQQQLEAYDAITNDSSYGQVKEIWEERLKEPRFLAEINSGRKHPLDAYKDVVIEHQKLMLIKASDTLKVLHGQKPITTPHVEQSVKGSVPPEPITDKKADLLNNVRADVDKGRRLSTNDELGLLDAVLSGK